MFLKTGIKMSQVESEHAAKVNVAVPQTHDAGDGPEFDTAPLSSRVLDRYGARENPAFWSECCQE